VAQGELQTRAVLVRRGKIRRALNRFVKSLHGLLGLARVFETQAFAKSLLGLFVVTGIRAEQSGSCQEEREEGTAHTIRMFYFNRIRERHARATAQRIIGYLPMEDDEPIRIPITDVFDLHSIPPRDIKPVVEEYLIEARRLGLRALRIIHGRGVGVQREAVRSILAKTPFVESFSDAPAEAGGWGATIVTLR
jgi:hypothetical protein